MAKFKAGDRVRLKREGPTVVECYGRSYVGEQGVIVPDPVEYPGGECVVRFDCDPRLTFAVKYAQLEPLVDPNAEWATEKVRQLIKMPVAA